MASIPRHIQRDPKFLYLTEWFSPEEAMEIVANKIPLNRPGVVPSVQVPPGGKGCDGLGETPSLLDVAGDIRAPVIGYDPNAVWATMPISMELTSGNSSPGSFYASGGAPVQRGGVADWAEDNVGLLLALMGGMAAVALIAKR